ncbi:MAG: hypothetical protein RLZZ479_679 [Bacteroidota bacterium]
MKPIKDFDSFINEGKITPEKLVNKIIKANPSLSWLKKELPNNYSLEDVEDILTSNGYGQEYDKFINESNKFAKDPKFEELLTKDAWEIGANTQELVEYNGERRLIYRCETNRGRDGVISRLKAMGFKSSQIGKSMEIKGFMYRYMVTLSEN